MRKFSYQSIASKIVLVSLALFFAMFLVGVIGFAMHNVRLAAVAIVCGSLMWPILIIGGIVLKAEDEHQRENRLD